VEIALARSLVDHLDEGDARRLWNKVSSSSEITEDVAVASIKGIDQLVPIVFKQRTLFDFLELAK
jgi:hypothetical protein